MAIFGHIFYYGSYLKQFTGTGFGFNRFANYIGTTKIFLSAELSEITTSIWLV
jgi:hypothetical protein